MNRWWQRGLGVLAGAAVAVAVASAEEEPGMQARTARAVEPGAETPWRYWLYLPERFFAATEGKERVPLLVFLHGSSGRGRDLAQVKRYGPPARVAREQDFPLALLAPQLSGGGWPAEGVVALLDEVLAEHPGLDPDRVYLTGTSLGGQGAWQVAGRAPERFAAFAPVCGYGDSRAAGKIGAARLPVWAFHGAVDDIIPIGPHRALAEAARAAGGPVRFTEFARGDHGNIIVPVYAEPRLYDWFLSHRRGKPGPVPAGTEEDEVLPGPTPGRARTEVATPKPVPSEGVAPADGGEDEPGGVWDRLFRWWDDFAAPPPPVTPANP
jgi:poly(3-hydroxybutyrate) depolymerase